MLNKTSILRTLILAVLFSSGQSHALDPYWAKTLAGLIGTVGIVTTFFKKDVYGLYLGATICTEPEIKAFYKDYYKDKDFGLREIWRGHKFLREMRSPDQLRTAINIHRLVVHTKKIINTCSEKVQQSPITASFRNAYNGYAEIAHNLAASASRHISPSAMQVSARLQAQSIANGLNSSVSATCKVSKNIGSDLTSASKATAEIVSTAYSDCSAALKRSFNKLTIEVSKTGNNIQSAMIKQRTAFEVIALRLGFNQQKPLVTANKVQNIMPQPIKSPLIHPIAPTLEKKAQNLSLKQRQQLGIIYLNHEPKTELKASDPAGGPQFAHAKDRAHFALKNRELDHGLAKRACPNSTISKNSL
jgi:hypothetical protein